MAKVPDLVHLVDFADDDAPKHKGDKALTISKAERVARLNQNGVKFYKPDQRPEFKKSVHRKKACPFCGLSRGKLMAICPRCKNCLACGSYNGEQGDLTCKNCGNYDSGKPEIVPTIVVN